MGDDSKFAKFHGVEREKISWFPKIDESKCIGCGLCTTTCGRGVYKYDFEKKKSNVKNPNHCMVACQTCANLCPVGAISFTQEGQTTREKAQQIVKNFQIIARARKELELRKEELELK